LRAGRFYDRLLLQLNTETINDNKEKVMKKYYFATIYKTEDDELFNSREALIEYVRDNWQEYCQPYGEEQKLVSIQDWEGRIILTYSTTGEDGVAVESEYFVSYSTTELTWLISELERMVARV
jgi:hypothetical protein